MEMELRSYLEALRAANDAGDPDGVCGAARLLLPSCILAQRVYSSIWTESLADEVKAELRRSLHVLPTPSAGADSEQLHDLGKFAWCRVYDRFAKLFPEAAAEFAGSVAACPAIVDAHIAAAGMR